MTSGYLRGSNNLLAGASAQGGYTIDNSLRLRSSASAYLNRTPATAGNRKTWTWSGWVKRGKLNSHQFIFCGGLNTTSNLSTQFQFDANNKLYLYSAIGGVSEDIILTTTPIYRDPSAWYHIVLVVDTTQATASNRVKIYVNGEQVTFDTTTYPTLNYDTAVNNTVLHNVANLNNLGAGLTFDGYLAEVNFIDGQALDPSSFGDYNEDTGVWQPAKYAGSYGTNGFYLNFSDATYPTTLAADSSGNGNNWTPNNISLTAGVTYDSMTDTPTIYADGGNYWTFNPLIPVTGATYSSGNLQYTSNSANKSGFASPLPATGKWYWEGVWLTNGGGSNPIIGIAQAGFENTQGGTGELGLRTNGNKFDQAGTETAYGASWTIGDVIGVVVDMDAGTIGFYKNGVSQGTAFTTVLTALTQPVKPMFRVNAANDAFAINFGQRPFTYTPPAGFLPLHTGNLPDVAIVDGSEYFAATTYTGNGGTQSIVNSGGFQPDLVWIKSRSTADSNVFFDSIRGVGRFIRSDATAAENGNSGDLMGAFNSNGVQVNTNLLGTTNGTTNGSGQPQVGWLWKAGGAAVTNELGSITSQVSASPTAGFSVVTYTGTGSAATVGHGLGVAPKMIISKKRSSTGDWNTYSSEISVTQVLYLNLTNAAGTGFAYNQTAPTSTVYSIAGGLDDADDYVAYCFSEVPGYSKFGSYTGNGSADGPFVYLGFRPAFLMVKRTTAAGNWGVWDTTRDTYNAVVYELVPNASDAETTAAGVRLDILSNGFKLRNTGVAYNASGSTYIYMAFAENPFKNSLAR